MDIMHLIIGSGILAVLYGIITSLSVLSADTGNDKMQEIAKAIQEGAGAYLSRQYSTIAIVGIVILIISYFLLGLEVAIGFIKPGNEVGLFASQVKHNGDCTMTGRLDHGLTHAVVVVKVVFGVTQLLSLKQVLQRTTIAAEITGVNQKVRVGQGCVLKNHGLGHASKHGLVPYNALSSLAHSPPFPWLG